MRVTAASRAPEAEAVGSGGLAPSFMELRFPVSAVSSAVGGTEETVLCRLSLSADIYEATAK